MELFCWVLGSFVYLRVRVREIWMCLCLSLIQSAICQISIFWISSRPTQTKYRLGSYISSNWEDSDWARPYSMSVQTNTSGRWCLSQPMASSRPTISSNLVTSAIYRTWSQDTACQPMPATSGRTSTTYSRHLYKILMCCYQGDRNTFWWYSKWMCFWQ
jgi:hypothetical protein